MGALEERITKMCNTPCTPGTRGFNPYCAILQCGLKKAKYKETLVLCKINILNRGRHMLRACTHTCSPNLYLPGAAVWAALHVHQKHTVSLHQQQKQGEYTIRFTHPSRQTHTHVNNCILGW